MASISFNTKLQCNYENGWQFDMKLSQKKKFVEEKKNESKLRVEMILCNHTAIMNNRSR